MTEQTIILSEIFTRIKTALKISSDAELAEKFNVPLRRLQTWKSRNTIPTELIISLSSQNGLDLNYVWCGTETAKEEPQDTTYTKPKKNSLPHDELKSDQLVDTIQMDNRWLRYSLNVEPENIVLVRVRGNNMSPWAVDGDLVIVNRAETTIINDAPYIINSNDVLMIKRLVDIHDGTIIAKSDSAYCSDEIFPEDNLPEIIGRIIRRITR